MWLMIDRRATRTRSIIEQLFGVLVHDTECICLWYGEI